MARVDVNGDHWLWQGATSHGYGVAQRGRRGEGTVKVHVAAWEALHGARPPGLDVRHLCGVRLCVRGEHLALGTREQNMSDAVSHGTIPRGELHGQARLTEAAVRWLRVQVLAGRSSRDVAAALGVSETAVRKAAGRLTWAHVH